MRSGTGRHRRPRQAPALFVTVGVTGAGLALPLLGASGAHASDDGTVWDRVAECESGGLWSANNDNGYYGGLQLTLETWESYGGTDYAERPDLASRGQQIGVAERILGDQGLAAWPSCALGAGLQAVLEELTGAGEDEPAPPGTGEPSGPGAPDGDEPPAPPAGGDPEDGETAPGGRDDREEPDDRRTPGPGDTTAPGPDDPSSGEPSAPSGGGTAQPVPEETGPPEGSGRHRGGPAPDDREEEAGQPSRGKRGKDSYRVRSGDSLSAIAAEHDLPGGWPALYEQNREVVGGDPDLILPGQPLRL
jgi:hypothetical protein